MKKATSILLAIVLITATIISTSNSFAAADELDRITTLPNNISTGTSYRDILVVHDDIYNIPDIDNVTFEPEARTNWHSHAGGQTLIVSGGAGYYQEEGQPAQIIRKGDVVMVGPNVKHWHGAAPDGWFSHITVATNPDRPGAEMMELITDEEYRSLQAVEYNGRVSGSENAENDLGDGFVFPKGEQMPGSENFSGPVYISQVVARDNSLNCPIMSNVTFEPGVINNWHTHGGGQVLIVTGGIGYHQMEGEPAEILYPGDVAMCPPGGTHWHGAVADSWFSHIAIGANPGTPGMEWLNRITDEEYANLPAPQYGDSFAAGTTAQSGRIIRAEEMYKEVFGDAEFPLDSTNPDYADIMNHFIYGDVYYQSELLTLRQRELITLVSLTANQSYSLLKLHVQASLNVGLTPEEITEAVYHCTPYVGFATTYDAVTAMNGVFLENGISLPLESQRRVEDDDRFDAGAAVQAEHFGMNPTRGNHITEFVSEYCFGDFYTRGALDFKERELLTMCILANMGVQQFGGHVRGAFNAGYSKDEIIAAVTQCMPYMGVPRTLSAISTVNQTLPDETENATPGGTTNQTS